jgi:hypothetical protein
VSHLGDAENCIFSISWGGIAEYCRRQATIVGRAALSVWHKCLPEKRFSNWHGFCY